MSRIYIICVLTSLSFVLTPSAYGGTIIKLGFNTDPLPDIQLSNGVLSTSDDLNGSSAGDQATEVAYSDALSGEADILGATASITLDDVQLIDSPFVFGNTLLHATQGGSFQLYDDSNSLLLAGSLGDGTLSGALGATATGGFLTTEFGEFTDGSLLPTLQDSALLRSSFSISLTNVNGGGGFATDDSGDLVDFEADATANIGAQLVPEPSSAALILLGLLGTLTYRRRN